MAGPNGNGGSKDKLLTLAVTALVGIILGGAPGIIATRDLAHEDDVTSLQAQISDLKTDVARLEQKLDDLTSRSDQPASIPTGG